MNLTGFQDEAVVAGRRSSSWPRTALALPTNFAALASMFLGWRLRGTLSDVDQEFLDTLAPPNWIAFLADADGYLHPQEVELFPLDSIMGTHKLGNGAVFSHRYCPDGAELERAYRIHTVLVNPDDPKSLVIGFLGPEDTSDQGRLENRFFELARGARQAYDDAEAAYARLQTNYCSADPCLIINRGSGRIMAINEAACGYLGEQAPLMIGSEVSALRSGLDAAIPTRKMQLRTLNQGLLCLVAWQWSSATLDATPVEPPGSVGRYLMKEGRQLRMLVDPGEKRPVPLDTKVSPRQHLTKQLDRLERLHSVVGVLLDHPELPVSTSVLKDEILAAAGVVGDPADGSGRLHLSGPVGEVSLSAAEGAIQSLLESILLSHRFESENVLQCEISVNPLPEIGGGRISVCSRLSPSVFAQGCDLIWRDLAVKLACRMDMRLQYNQDSENNQLITDLTFAL
ncbi:MAG: hypothetical protein ABIE70_07880 [bacterium]